MMNIPISRTIFEEDDFKNIIKPLQTGWVVQGPYVKEFEEKWSKFTGAKHSIAVSNCTTGLHISLAALGIKPGDEVIVPAFTWIATANVIEYMGAKPVFCDINSVTFNIDESQIEALITDKTKAIIPVHLFGYPANMEAVMDLALQYNLKVVEDAACGFAGRYNGKHVGTIGDTGAFSFHPRKALTTGEGGMITTEDDELATLMRSLRDHGASISDLQRHHGAKPYLLPEFPVLGYNFRMTDIQASIGSTQMDRAQQIYEARNKWAEAYDEALLDIEWLSTPLRDEGYIHGFQAYVCTFMANEVNPDNVSEINAKRNSFMDYLQKHGVSTRPGTHAVHMLDYYKKKYNLHQEDFPGAYIADQSSIAFPLFPSMKQEEFDYVITTIKNFTMKD